MKLITFKKEKKYQCCSPCNYECVWEFKIIKRTEKTVSIKDVFTKDIIIKKIKVIDNIETISPLGVYSMSPVLRASAEVI